jgi:hypothetical protein
VSESAYDCLLQECEAISFSMYCAMAIAHFFAGRYSEAISLSERVAREKPDILLPVIVAAASNAQAGRIEEAEQAMAQVRRIDPSLKISNLRDLVPDQSFGGFREVDRGPAQSRTAEVISCGQSIYSFPGNSKNQPYPNEFC